MTVALVGVVVVLAVLVAPGRRPLPTVAPSPAPPSRSATSGPPADPAPAEVAEVARLLAGAVRSGIGLLEAVEVVAEHGPPAAAPVLRRVAAAQRWSGDDVEVWRTAGPRWAAVAQALAATHDAGASPVRALEAAARAVEREQQSRAVAAVGRVEVLVVLPLGLAFLPGFVLTTVVPVVVGLLRVTLPG